MSESNTIKEENLITILMYRYYPYWPVFAVLVTIGMIAAWGYLRYTAPSYEATATLIIKDQRKGVDEPQMTEAINMFSSKKIVENEIEVIRSRALLKRVVIDLHLYAPVFEQEGFTTKSAYLSSPVLIKLKKPDELPEGFDKIQAISFDYDSLKNKVLIDNKAYPLSKWVKTPYGEMQFFPNKNYREKSESNLYFYFLNPQIVSEAIQQDLEVYPASKLSTVVTLKLRDKVRQRGEDILNQLIHAYNQLAIIDRNTLASNTLAFIEDRISYVEKELDILEGKVQEYKSVEGIVDLSEQGKVILQSESENDRQLADINIKLAVLDKVERYVLDKDKSAGIVPATLGLNDPVLSQLLNKLYDSEIQYQKLRRTTAENNPILASLSGEIENIRPSILENIRNQRESLLATRSKITLSKGRFATALQSIPKQERELLEINRQKAIKNSVYSFLLQKREETALSYAPTAADSKVVDMAESSIWPVSPKPSKIYLMAIVLSIFAGIAFVAGKEFINSKIMFRSEIEEYTSKPIVAELSKVKRKKGAQFKAPTEAVVVEQFRQMRTTLGLYGRTFAKKKILVTSSIPGEGKSFVSTNLALSLASSGKKVILLDLDLRNPSTTAQFNCLEQKGITDFLNADLNLNDIITETAFQNLFLLTAGQMLGDNTDTLLNGKLESLISQLEDAFDYIIMDSSPIDLVSDAYLLSEFCDITLLVMRHAYTPKSVVYSLNQGNKSNKLKNLAIVFNGVKARGLVKGYGLGYGYGNEHVYKERYLKYHKYLKS